MSLKDFDYSLPQELIAQEPAKPRDHARLLCLDKNNGGIIHRRFDDLSKILKKGDILVINDSKVFPARLLGHKKETGGRVEVFLHKHKQAFIWECLIGGKVKAGAIIVLGLGLEGRLLADQGDGTWLVSFNFEKEKFWKILERIGRMPLPPYITPNEKQHLDRVRYQTVYAAKKNIGSVAAPTAGLHFTKRLLKQLSALGVLLVPVTLHVGLGTFASVKEDNIIDHKMHSEYVSITKKSAQLLARAKKNRQRIIGVGTTSCRVLESYGQAIKQGKLSLGESYNEWTEIFIYPGYKFELLDSLITNFHLPKSSLLMLVSALAGEREIKEAYKQAIASNYRFYSYGDAMFIG
ncbi:MAG: tRNA preQ1(34) S-adenosylmethionine ribosyltransferase-isomerase QueA [Patescibacteria group bacterium]|nr:tRNA preQ1(34) S-adenosylmethionine ribosyltransferase-isomerase QueA [Patescibacteria group bacterium]